MTDFFAGIAVVFTVVGWIWLLGFLMTERREKRLVTQDNMKWARENERAKIRAEVLTLDHAPGCQGAVPGLCWCPINRVLALLSKDRHD